MKKQNGITLVALVITIIVLLILAGVSISLALGNNGVLTRSSQAVVENEKGTVTQDIKLGAADAITTYWTAWAQNASVKKGDYFTSERFYKSATLADSSASGVSVVDYKAKSAVTDPAAAITAAPTSPATTGLTTASDGYIIVKYVVKSSNKVYYARINVENGDLTAISNALAS